MPVANISTASPVRTRTSKSFSAMAPLHRECVKAIRLPIQAWSRMEASVWRGDRFVVALYAVLVAVSGVFGYVIGLINPENLDPRLFFLIDLPGTPLGLALYGVLTVGIVLGALLVVVWYVGRVYDPHRVE